MPSGTTSAGSVTDERTTGEVRDALSHLREAAQTPSNVPKVELVAPVKTVCDFAYERGWPSKTLHDLVQIITQLPGSHHSSINTLIKNLYPRERVSDEVIYKIVAILGPGKLKAAPQTQVAWLRWMIMIYDYLDRPAVLSGLYGVLFNLLDTMSIRPYLCHLLSIITRRKHVRPFRIQMLLELARKVGNEAPLVGLIRIYKDYYPDVIVSDMLGVRTSGFQHPDTEWRQRLLSIQEAESRKMDAVSNRQPSFKVVRRGLDGAKRIRVATVPAVHTSQATEASVTLEEIENVEDFVQKLELLELPNQIAAVLGDTLFQKYLALRRSDSSTRRLESWLLTFFEEELGLMREGGAQMNTGRDVLNNLLTYTCYTKALSPASLVFLRRAFVDWDGKMHREVILGLAAYLPLQPFGELQTAYTNALEAALLDGSTASQVTLLEYYTSLLRMWTVALHSLPPSAVPESHIAAFQAVIARTGVLCLTLLASAPASAVSTQHAVLSFYEAVTSAYDPKSHALTARITVPPALLIYTLFFTSSLSTLSRLCSILAGYKRALEAALAPGSDAYPRENVNQFNGFLMDLCNCLWRNRALNRDDVNANGCLMPPSHLPLLHAYVEGQGLALSNLFSLSHSSILCALSIVPLREMEDREGVGKRHAGPVTQKSLAKLGTEGGVSMTFAAYKLDVLRWLDERGIGGVGELMFNTMKHLMTARGGNEIAGM